MDLKFETFVRKPFTVEAIEVTEENLKEVAKLIGRVDTEPNGSRYIKVNKNKVPNVTKVSAGYWVTRMGGSNNNLRAYSPKTFNREFVTSSDVIDRLLAEIAAEKAAANG